jgi:Na+/phosphate symporter
MNTIADKYNTEAEKHPEGSEARKLLQWAAIEIPDKGEYITEILEEHDHIVEENKRIVEEKEKRIQELEFHLRKAIDNAYQVYWATQGVLKAEPENEKKKSQKSKS